jgi:hypothetical protein
MKLLSQILALEYDVILAKGHVKYYAGPACFSPRFMAA